MKLILLMLCVFVVINAKELSYDEGYKAGLEDGLKESQIRTDTLKSIEKYNNAKNGEERARAQGNFNANFDFLCISPIKMLYKNGMLNKEYTNGYIKGCEKSLFK